MFYKYIIIGALNTLVTGVILFSMMYLGFGVYKSNFFGYLLGIVFSFVLNTLFTFSTKLSWRKFIKFLLNCGICYLINIGIMISILYIQPDWVYFSQLCGMCAYTVSSFVFNKLWVMK